MSLIELKTFINAPIQRCFDLSRSIDLHQISTAQTREKAIAGVTSGLIDVGQSVTWRAKHFGVWQNLTSAITEFNSPTFFVDEMEKGAFKYFRHEHIFRMEDGGTILIDRFNYQAPLGVLGRLVDMLFLKKYMTKLLIERNKHIKTFAESEQWKLVLYES